MNSELHTAPLGTAFPTMAGGNRPDWEGDWHALGTIDADTPWSIPRFDIPTSALTAPEPFSISFELTASDTLRAQRTLARILGENIPTTAGVMLWPDTERRAAALARVGRIARDLAGLAL